MPNAGLPPSLPVAATMDLQYRLPPIQQIWFTPTIVISLILLAIAVVVVIYLSHRSRAKAKREARREALRMAEKILVKRGGSQEDVDRILNMFNSFTSLDPASIVMVRDRFHDELRPLLEQNYGRDFADRMERIYFPPPKDTRRALAAQTKDVKSLVEEQKSTTTSQTAAAIIDLMDATLKPGVITRLAFEGMEGGYECLVMGHDMQTINVTLPAHNDVLLAALHPGLRVDGTLESGPSLLAFTANVVQAIAGSMPYCRLTPWKSAWEIRKRDSIRLPISLEIDFQHISTSSADSIKMSNLEREIGAIRPGRLIDISLGGCCVETPSSGVFQIGDMIRFSKSLVTGNPPATLLGALVKIDSIDPNLNEGSIQRLHIQFLVIDDVSQRILVRTLRQLQDVADRDEWMQAQQLMQRMRRNKIQNIGSPAAVGIPRRDSTNVQSQSKPRPDTRAMRRPTTRNVGPAKPPTGQAARISTRNLPKAQPRPSTRSQPKVQPRPSTRSIPKPPPRPPTRGNPKTPPRDE